jgi:hypothetical protein
MHGTENLKFEELKLEIYKSYRNDQQDATVLDNLLFHCSLTAQHVWSDIIAHHQELLNCNYSFWCYSRLLLPAADCGRQRQTRVKPEAVITV